MADIHAECEWDERTLNLNTLSLFLPQIPDEIVVRKTDDRDRDEYSARVLIYKPERTARRIAVFSEGTDFTVGHTECSECKCSINPYAKWCEHCGAKFEG